MNPPRVAAVFLLVLAASRGVSLPKAIRPCKVDASLNRCAVKRANEAWPTLVKGDPRNKIPSLDPLLLGEVKSASGQGNLRLSILAQDIKIVGFKNVKVEDSRIDLKKKRMEFEVYVPKVDVDGRYKLDGVFLVLPIKGSGRLNITLTDLRIGFKVDYTLEKSNKDVQLMKIGNTEQTLFNMTNMAIRLDSLFNGNKQLTDGMNAVLNENWREFMEELGPYSSFYGSKLLKATMEAILGSVPYKEIFLF